MRETRGHRPPPVPTLRCACGSLLSLGYPMATRLQTNLTACAACETPYVISLAAPEDDEEDLDLEEDDDESEDEQDEEDDEEEDQDPTGPASDLVVTPLSEAASATDADARECLRIVNLVRAMQGKAPKDSLR